MKFRFVPLAFLVLFLGVPAAYSQIQLKPFRPDAHAAEARSLAGAWKGTFIFERKENGGREEVSYRVEIGSDMGSLKVTALPPFSSDPDSRLSPITGGFIPADWDGEFLRAHAQKSFLEGKADVLILKKYLLRPGADERHIGVSYEITVKSTTSRSERSDTVRGRGELVRVR
jgi:hypothetical protein